MKCTNILLLPLLSGCISPGIRLDAQDTGASIAVDTAEVDDPVETDDPIDTGDTEDTQDTQDTQDTSQSGDGEQSIDLRIAREYLLFDGSLGLFMTTRDSEDSPTNEFSMILSPFALGCGSHVSTVRRCRYHRFVRGRDRTFLQRCVADPSNRCECESASRVHRSLVQCQSRFRR